MRCLSCKYDLAQLTEHRCPECGRAFDPNDSTTFERHHRNGTLIDVILGASMLLGFVVIVLLTLWLLTKASWIIQEAIAT